MQLEIFSNFIIGAIGAASTVIAYLFARRKSKAEAQGNEIDNVEKGLLLYREMLNDLKKELIEQKSIMHEQKLRIIALEAEIILLKNKECL